MKPKITPEQKQKLRTNWREAVINYRKMKGTVWKIILCPQATAEHVMPAKEKMVEVHKWMREMQGSLDALGVLGFHDPRMEG